MLRIGGEHDKHLADQNRGHLLCVGDTAGLDAADGKRDCHSLANCLQVSSIPGFLFAGIAVQGLVGPHKAVIDQGAGVEDARNDRSGKRGDFKVPLHSGP